jgi:N-methylhydantoinase A
MRVGVDIGGTFTDIVGFDEATGDVTLGKAASTRDDLTEGITTGLSALRVPLADVDVLIHGSTIVINSLIERRGARSALVTTQGFRDVYEIGRINRPESFNPNFQKHRPLIPRELIFEIPERVLPDGTIHTPFDEQAARNVAARIVALGIEAVAVVFLHSYAVPDNELRMAEILSAANPKLYVTTSHEISREYREYERTSTVAANAYVGPVVSSYLGRLEDRLHGADFTGNLMIMQSNGGLSDVATARRQCVQMVESGPAGGVVGTMAMCEQIGVGSAVAFDMGGTTAKASVVQSGQPSYSADYYIGGYARGLVIRVPVLEIVEAGTGGGSIAWLDPSRQIHVGPRSAGAAPGPACYGLGGSEPTITDANVALGRLSPEAFLGGGMRLDVDAAIEALRVNLAEPLGVSIDRAAVGILEVATSAMANVVRNVTLQRGLDPREFTLFAYGGGGPVHGTAVAQQLGIKTVIVPQSPGHFSAFGMLMADLRRDFAQTLFARLDSIDLADLRTVLRRLEGEGREALSRAGITGDRLRFEYGADFRYLGQEHSVTVAIPGIEDPANGDSIVAEMKRRFDKAHEIRFGHSAPGESAEMVSLRVSAIGAVAKPTPTEIPRGSAQPPASAQRPPRRIVYEDCGPATARGFERAQLLAGNVIEGPAVIEEAASTTLLAPGDIATIGSTGYIHIAIGART